ncbi:MAG TPA: tannase/feruloyl esterase family alpha/beta hydrolase [Ramlibacter sp.]|nr:tannase/feruloyl esterase family alpha/beta hydrolase [Ramlibacter sp.]
MIERATRRFSLAAAAIACGVLAACSTTGSRTLGGNPAAACAALNSPIASGVIGIPSGAATIDSATWMPGSAMAVAERGPTPAARITPMTPPHCRVLGKIAPLDPKAPAIQFQVNLPARWNGRSVQYGGGGFNGVLISGLSLVPAARFEQPAPLAQGYVTYGTDSGHQNVAGQPPQTFALNDEALVNFAHASYKKVRDVAVTLMQRAYGSGPEKLYFVGSSEGGREGLTMAQRYPRDFDGIFSRVPVINWTALQHAGTRNGVASMGEGWLRPAQVKLVHDAVLAACDAADGVADGVVSNFDGCLRTFDPAKLRCATGAGGDTCLNESQVRAVQTLRTAWRSPFPLAHGVTEYPGWGIGGEGTPAFGPSGGWNAWWMGSSAPAIPPQPSNGIAWVYGSGALLYFYARNPQLDVRQYRPENFAPRIAEVSQLMDSTNPDLSAFHARGGKLIMLEHMADYAQSPYAGIRYYESVVARMGKDNTDRFLRLYTAPGVDHVGSGAPANVDMLGALANWVERGQAPSNLQLVEQEVKAPAFNVIRSRPLCEWPAWPRYRSGDPAQAASFECTK